MKLPLFVYGTLQRGFAAHTGHCRGAQYLGRARTIGTLCEHEAGFPVLVVKPSRVLAAGSRNAYADAHRARLAPPFDGPAPRLFRDTLAGNSRLRLVEGEILALTASDARLTTLDAYEGYSPGRPSLYVRALLEVGTESGPRLAWAYVAGALMRAESLHPLDRGRWRTAAKE
jgi:gamma-glutamylcyclotransferase (GGCT)/AIG2-like uncharacterized protein YtfP